MENDFSDFQIIFLTHDKALFHFFKNRTDENKWKYFEMYAEDKEIEIDGEVQSVQVPKILDSNSYLCKAYENFKEKEYEVSALFLRKTLEQFM